MPALIGQGISQRGISQDDFNRPFFLTAGMVAADVGKPVALSTALANTVKLAGAGDHILGKLLSFENRVVEGVLAGTVGCRGGFTFTKAAAAAAIVLGDSIVGFLAGEVGPRRNAGNTANEPLPTANLVVEIVGTQITVII